GLALMGRALVQGTWGLQGGQAQGGDRLARNTAEAMQSGVRQAAAGLIERTLRETARRLGCNPRLLLTGGDADSIAAQLEMAYELRPDLVLEGLLVLTRREA
ncbi:MAG: type III pantothenate kinase, partial [Methylococcaceae bacterium]|nr:type III pantothenate kinase [Methylococcaceae bacterium]